MNAPKSRIDAAYGWLSENCPEVVASLRASSNEMADVISHADMMGPKTDLELHRARFLIAAAEAAFPIIAIATFEANKRSRLSRYFTYGSRAATILFSVGTLAVLNSGLPVSRAQWMAAGSVVSSLSSLVAAFYGKLGGGKRALNAQQAVDKLTQLDFELRKNSFELQGHVAGTLGGTQLTPCINRTNALFDELNSLKTALGIQAALDTIDGLLNRQTATAGGRSAQRADG